MNFVITWKGVHVRRDSVRGRLCVGARKLAAYGVQLIPAMVFSIILCPLAALYGFGRYITTVVSLWRLIEHDYGTTGGGKTTNMNPALRVLYHLALLQGVIFYYRESLRFAGKTIAIQVAQGYKFDQGVGSLVWGYLEEARIGCETDPSFAKGRNLITYAVDLMESHSPDDLLSGTRILDTLITYDESPQSPKGQEERNCRRMPMVTERLIGSSSSGKILQKLLEALGSRSSSPCEAEMRKRATKIVYALAGDIRLKQIPGAIGCISSLLDASLYQELNGYKELMLQGLHIIEKLATDKDNCRVMSDTPGLLGKILKPLSSEILHRVSHDVWPDVVDASLEVLCCWLGTVVGESSRELHQEISGNLKAINAMQSILACDVCHKTRRKLVIKVLITQLYKKERDKVVEMQLLDIFLRYNDDEYITGLAGEKLVMLSKARKSNAEIILSGSNNNYVQDTVNLLCRTPFFPVHQEPLSLYGLRDINVMNKPRISAAGILEGLCSHYTAGVDCFEALKTLILTELMPKMLTQILRPRSQIIRDKNEVIFLARTHRFEELRGVPPETLQALPHDVRQELPRDLQIEINAIIVVWREERKLQVALLSLWLMVYNKLITADEDLLLLFKMVSNDQEFNFPRRLMDVVELNTQPEVVDCLRILKLAAKMSISMMRHMHTYNFTDVERLIASLKDASKKMMNVDAFVHLSGSEGGDTLTSLVQEAGNLFRPTEEAQQPEDKKKGKEPEIAPFEKGQSSSS